MLAAVSQGRVYGFQVIQETGLPGRMGCRRRAIIQAAAGLPIPMTTMMATAHAMTTDLAPQIRESLAAVRET